MIFTDDHEPAHVHARGRGVQAVFLLNCSGGPVVLQRSEGTTAAEETALARFITENRAILCGAWEELHGHTGRA
ncbi:DUF4160 domain-containing protein [Granulicella sp. S156]|uniref:DUF4160 domain-containing protein n=1 Tax=Granulicella sp. S156 TaxID=1747224 RepID=UPI00352B6231